MLKEPEFFDASVDFTVNDPVTTPMQSGVTTATLFPAEYTIWYTPAPQLATGFIETPAGGHSTFHV